MEVRPRPIAVIAPDARTLRTHAGTGAGLRTDDRGGAHGRAPAPGGETRFVRAPRDPDAAEIRPLLPQQVRAYAASTPRHRHPDALHLANAYRLAALSPSGRRIVERMDVDGVDIEVLADDVFATRFEGRSGTTRVRGMRIKPAREGVVRHSGASTLVFSRSALADPVRAALALVYHGTQHRFDRASWIDRITEAAMARAVVAAELGVDDPGHGTAPDGSLRTWIETRAALLAARRRSRD